MLPARRLTKLCGDLMGHFFNHVLVNGLCGLMPPALRLPVFQRPSRAGRTPRPAHFWPYGNPHACRRTQAQQRPVSGAQRQRAPHKRPAPGARPQAGLPQALQKPVSAADRLASRGQRALRRHILQRNPFLRERLKPCLLVFERIRENAGRCLLKSSQVYVTRSCSTGEEKVGFTWICSCHRL